VFAGETVVVLILMLFLKLIPATVGRKGWLDMPGAVLSVAGLGLAVFGILRSSQWGWIKPAANVPIINGQPFTPLGLSPTIWCIVLGGILLNLFVRREESVKASGREPLADLALLKIGSMRAGLTTLFCQQFIIMATFFVLPLYLQTVLGLNSLDTGIKILPLSIALLVCALGGSALTGKYSPKLIVEVGLGLMLGGELALLYFVSPELKGAGFAVALAMVGAGLGLLASQLGNVIMSSVGPERGGEAGGFQGTAQNLGASLGTALIGSVLIAALATNFTGAIVGNPEIPDQLEQQIVTAAEKSANFVTVAQVRSAVESAGVPAAETDVIVKSYEDAQISSLQAAFAGIAIFALLALVYVRRLPDGKDLSVQAKQA
jgi:Na+/melibiose symporter-like transporter